MTDVKLALIFNSALSMPVGKLAVQAGHAVQLAIQNNMIRYTDIAHVILLKLKNPFMDWYKSDLKKKIALKVSSEDDLIDLKKQAIEKNLIVSEVIDVGLTFFEKPTLTCIAIGPDFSYRIDEVTRRLSLL